MFKKILEIELTKLAEELKAKHIELGMKASGKWLSSVTTEVEVSEKIIKGIILAEDYTEQLVDGRQPGKFPPINAIKKWIDDKPIIFDEKEISKNSLAFLIARAIAKKGTKYYQQGGTELTDSVFTDEKVNEIISKIGDVEVSNVFAMLNKKLQKV